MKRILAVLLTFVLLLNCCPSLFAIATSNTMILQGDISEQVFVNADTILDLNGFSITGMVTVADGCTLTVKDSQTDDYTVEDESGYGKLANATGNVDAADGYLPITGESGISFHKVDLNLTSVTLRPENAGIYYGGEFFGDEVVAANVDRFGIALRLDKAPDAAYMRISSAYSWYENFAAGADGNTVTGTLLKDVMKKGITTAENKARSQYKIYASAYFRMTDGQYIFSQSQNYSFMRVMQLADAQWSKLTKAQKSAMEALYNRFKTIISTWDLPNFNKDINGDIDIPI